MANNECISDSEIEEGAFYANFDTWLIYSNLKLFFDTKYKYFNLLNNNPPGNNTKIPLISHHIYLTKSNANKEIPDTHLENLEQILSTLDNDGVNWQHIFWTNCKSCIPASIERISQQHIEIIEIANAQTKVPHYPQIMEFLSNGYIGIAVNILRYDILTSVGGFYLDNNFKLSQSPLKYMQFDFFATSFPLYIANHCIGSVANHPILVDTLNTIDKNIVNLPSRIEKAQNCSVEDYTEMMTYEPLIMAFLKHSNQYSFKDFAIPVGKELAKMLSSYYILDNEQPLTDFDRQKLLLWENEICLADHLVIGCDSFLDSGTWL